MGKTVGVDDFAVSLQGILDEVGVRVNAETPKCVRSAVAKGRRVAKSEIAGKIRHGKTAERYIGGFATKTKVKGTGAHGSIGNKTAPGLVHLLEKGHAKVGGGRVRSIEHMAPAREAAIDELKKQLVKRIGEALS